MKERERKTKDTRKEKGVQKLSERKRIKPKKKDREKNMNVLSHGGKKRKNRGRRKRN